MLSLKPPFVSVNGVALFPDHADPLRWYFLRMRPRVSVGAAGRKQLSLTKFRSGNDIAGGLLEFDVDLGLDDAEREAVKRVLADVIKRLGAKGTPVLAPVPAVSGSANVMLFGTRSGQARPAGVAAAATPFTEPRMFPTSPSLFGDNHAVFSVLLVEGWSATLLERTLGDLPGDISPVGVLYELEIEGLRPAYDVHVTARWDVLHDTLENSFKGNILWAGAEIASIVDKLIEERVIDIQVDDFTSDAQQKAAKDAAVTHARAFVFDSFFKPAPPPEPAAAEESGWDKAGALIEDVARLASTGGVSSWGHFTWASVDRKQIDKRSLELALNERTTIKQKVYPSAHLTDLVSGLPDEATLVREVRTDDDAFYKTRRLTVGVDVDLTAEKIAGIRVEARYAGETRSAHLAPAAGGVTAAVEIPDGWPARVVGGEMQRELDVGYTVYFRQGTGAEFLPASLSAPLQTISGDYYTVSPRSLYWLKTVRFEAGSDFPWDRYARVEVFARYGDPAAGARAEEHFVLRDVADGRLATWTIFQRDRAREAYEYRLVLTEKTGGKRIHVPDAKASPDAPPFRTATVPFVAIEDPRPGRRTFRVTPKLDWGVFESAEVMLFYEDKRVRVTFDADNDKTTTVELQLADPELTRVAYEVALYRIDDDTPLRIPRSFTEAFRLTVSPAMKGRQTVAVATAGGAFSDKKLRAIDVQLARTPTEAVTALCFERGGERKDFTFEVAPGDAGGFHHRVTYRYANELTYDAGWQRVATAAAALEIPLLAFPG